MKDRVSQLAEPAQDDLFEVGFGEGWDHRSPLDEHQLFFTACASGNHKTAARPFLSRRLNSFREGPLGRFSPIYHFCTVERLMFNTEANTAWLTCSFSRNDLIFSGVIS